MCCHSAGDLPNPGTKPVSPASPALAGRFFASSATWEAPFWLLLICNELHQNRQASNNHFISLMILWVGASGRPQLGSSSLILMESAECGRVHSHATSPLCGLGAPLTCGAALLQVTSPCGLGFLTENPVASEQLDFVHSR